MNAAPALEPAAARGWCGRLDLGYVRGAARTELRQRGHRGPLCVQRPFYPEAGGVCHTYLLHPPGGMVGGDEMELNVRVGPTAHALLTTPGAGKFYRSPGARSRVAQRLQVDARGVLEWLPQEAIFFDGARACITTRVALARDTRFIGWELACLGRPASRQPFAAGDLDVRFELHRESRPLVLERLRVAPPQLAAAPAGWRAHAATGTLYGVGLAMTHEAAALVESIREAVAACPHPAGVSVIEDVVICRALAPDALGIRALFAHVWSLLRQALLGRAASPPRIWQT